MPGVTFSLSAAEQDLSLIECYKIVFGLSHLKFNDFFEYMNLKSTRANHSYKLYVKGGKVNAVFSLSGGNR